MNHDRRRTLAWLLGVATGVGAGAAGVAISRTAISGDRRRADPEARERLAELPAEDLGPVVSFDGTLLTVRSAGDPSNPVVVFSHGFSLDMTTWHYQWKELSERYRCVLFDHRGHGESGAAEGSDYSLQAMGEDLVAVLDAAVGEGPAILVGHSMGGMAILAMAERHPEEFRSRIAGVVFADTAAAEVARGALAGVTARIHALVSAPKRAERIHRFLRAGQSDLAYAVARLTQFGPKAPPSMVDHVARISGRAPLEVWGDGLAGILRMDFRHAVEHVRVPSLVVVGDVDRVTPPASALALKDALPDADLVVLKGAGHLAMMERHEQFNRVVGRFLDRVTADVANRAALPAPPARSGRQR